MALACSDCVYDTKDNPCGCNHPHSHLEEFWDSPQSLCFIRKGTIQEYKSAPSCDKAHYVLGFLFNTKWVLLIRKERPSWQKGKLNGVGGKVEPGETPIQAMVREFKEETGVTISSWKQFAVLTDPTFEVTCFWSHSDNILSCQTVTDEHLELVEAKRLPADVLDNLKWLIPMARAGNNSMPLDHLRIEYVR